TASRTKVMQPDGATSAGFSPTEVTYGLSALSIRTRPEGATRRAYPLRSDERSDDDPLPEPCIRRLSPCPCPELCVNVQSTRSAMYHSYQHVDVDTQLTEPGLRRRGPCISRARHVPLPATRGNKRNAETLARASRRPVFRKHPVRTISHQTQSHTPGGDDR